MSNYATRESRWNLKFIQKRDSREPQNTFDFISTCDDIEARKKSWKKISSQFFLELVFWFASFLILRQVLHILVLFTFNANQYFDTLILLEMLYVLLRESISEGSLPALPLKSFLRIFQNPVLFWEWRSRSYSELTTRVYFLMITPWTLFHESASGFYFKARFSLLFSRFSIS